jgi:leader peptidase (prepilin peptidase) / N-methyltransferase
MTRLAKANTIFSASWWLRTIARSRNLRELIDPSVRVNALLAMLAIAAISISLISLPGTLGVLAAGLALTMLTIAVIDWRSFIIPDWLNASAGALAMVYAIVQEPEAMVHAVATATLRGLVVALVFLGIRAGYARLRSRQGLGMGDVKLAFVAGAWLDWIMIPLAIQLAAFAALSVYVLRQVILRETFSAVSRVPFGLFFAPAIWFCLVLEVRWLALP